SRPGPDAHLAIPTVDLSAPRSTIVDQIRRAASTLGFFQIVNHSVPHSVLKTTIGAIRAFHEQTVEEKSQFYTRGVSGGVSFSSNVDLFVSKAASWRDTLTVRLGPEMAAEEAIPEVCRAEVVQWRKEVERVGEVLMEFLSEGLGLEATRLKTLTCLGGKMMVGHYYPYCPEPDLTVGITTHTDPGVLTVLMQSESGLQVKSGEGDAEEWIDVQPLEGALVINIGDILQIMSNKVYKSVQHRVLANPNKEPRVSVAVFFNPSNREGLFGPLPEVVTAERPAEYKQFTLSDYMRRFFSKELDGKTLSDYYKA
uniref:Fe2OG dioxygenase domain-containing protein n=1 Tax=Kalanchoe fedtschenkoi TaxID=63787 RepID=A0A7N0TGI8_KALFE